MRMFTKAAILAAALAIPAVSFAQAPAAAPKADKKAAAKSAANVATHTTSGTVKSVSDSSLVITGKGAKEETFTLNASTKKTGDVKEGAKVTVAYTTEGSAMTATSIKASAAKASKKSTAKK
jgi:hypothetical protein